MKTLLIFMLTLALLACGKDDINPNPKPANPTAVRWGYVNDKFYSDSAGFPGGQYRRYWVKWAHDTTCPPANPNCGYLEDKRVTRACYDTLFQNRYPERLPDSVFIAPYPY